MHLARVETEVPAAEAQCCCCQGDDAPTWYRLTIIDFKVPDLLRAPLLAQAIRTAQQRTYSMSRRRGGSSQRW